MFDTIYLECAGCGKEISSQTKILGTCSLDIFVVGLKDKDEKISPSLIGSTFNETLNDELSDCIFKVKNKCMNCGKQNLIRIEKRKLVEVIKDKNEEILASLGNKVIEEGIFSSTIQENG